MFLPSFAKHFVKKLRDKCQEMDVCLSMCNCDKLEKTFINYEIAKDLRARLNDLCEYEKSPRLKYEDHLKFFYVKYCICNCYILNLLQMWMQYCILSCQR